MSETNEGSTPLNLLEREFRQAEERAEESRRAMMTARLAHEECEHYLQVLRFVRTGASLVITQPGRVRGFFVRKLVDVVGARCRTYRFDELYVPSFSEDPALVQVLPAQMRGTLDDCLRRPCTKKCGNGSAFVVGILTPSTRGYHAPGDSVTFFTVCTGCKTTGLIDSGVPAEGSAAEFDTASA